VREKPTRQRLLADENTSHRFVSACRRLIEGFPIIHIARWQDGSWLGLDDAALLMAGAEAGLVLVAVDRATLPWDAGQVLRRGRATADSSCSVARFGPPTTASRRGCSQTSGLMKGTIGTGSIESSTCRSHREHGTLSALT
jgi:hypothetical protein